MKLEIRSKILNLVKEFYKESISNNSDFKPGIDMVPFTGRIYDDEEMTNLVDSSLDFWLTTGRYAEEFERKFVEVSNNVIV
jgi:CDP-4-dehydro-6-deoxyglucose reductase, E1